MRNNSTSKKIPLLIGFSIGLLGSGVGFGAIGAAALVPIWSIFILINKKFIVPYKKNIDFALFLTLSIGLLILGLVCSSLLSNSFEPARLIVIIFSYASIGILFFLCLVLFSEQQLISMLKGYVFGVITLGFIGISLVILFSDFSSSLNLTRHAADRLVLWMGANTLAMQFVFGFLSLNFLLQRSLIFNRSTLLSGLSSSILIAGVILTGSIGGFVILISVLIGLIAGKLVRGKSRVRYILRSALFLIFILFILFILWDTLPLQRIVAWLEIGFGSEALESGQRLSHWREGFRLVGLAPIVGHGVGAGNFLSQVGTIHNAYLLIWIEGGIVSVFGILMFFLFLSLPALKIPLKDAMILILFIFSMAMYLTIRTHGYQLYLWFPIAVVYSLLVGIKRVKVNAPT